MVTQMKPDSLIIDLMHENPGLKSWGVASAAYRAGMGRGRS
jgi:hypothetical protein